MAFGELCKLLFVKIQDEKLPRKNGEPYEFQIKTHEPSRKLAERIKAIYDAAKQKDPKVFTDTIRIDDATIKYSQYDVILTIRTDPAEANTVTPPVGDHGYAQGINANISTQRFVDCPDVYVFDHWEGDVNDPNSANTTVVMDNDKTVTAVFVDGRQCGDECHPSPEGDVNKDCKVNFFDIAVVGNTWLDCTDPNCD